MLVKLDPKAPTDDPCVRYQIMRAQNEVLATDAWRRSQYYAEKKAEATLRKWFWFVVMVVSLALMVVISIF